MFGVQPDLTFYLSGHVGPTQIDDDINIPLEINNNWILIIYII